MSDDFRDWQDDPVKVVHNQDLVVSIWPADRANPPGWVDAGISGSKEQCLAWINENCDGNCRLKQPGK